MDHPLGNRQAEGFSDFLAGLRGDSPEGSCSAFETYLARLVRMMNMPADEMALHERVEPLRGEQVPSVGRLAWDHDVRRLQEAVRRFGNDVLRAGRRLGVNVGPLAVFLEGRATAGLSAGADAARAVVKAIHEELVTRRALGEPVDAATNSGNTDPADTAPPVSKGMDEPFVLTPVQKAILEALNGKGLRTDALARRIGVDRRTLFKPGGIKELTARGLVRNHRRIGYYRPDALPPELQSPAGAT